MNGFLIDTNVLSEYSRLKGPDPLVGRWVQSLNPKSLYVSVLTLAEILRGIELREPGRRRTELEKWFRNDLRAYFAAENVLDVTETIGTHWALLTARLARRGIPLAFIDGLLAATAMEHDLIIATRDSDLALTGVPIFNPWEP